MSINPNFGRKSRPPRQEPGWAVVWLFLAALMLAVVVFLQMGLLKV